LQQVLMAVQNGVQAVERQVHRYYWQLLNAVGSQVAANIQHLFAAHHQAGGLSKFSNPPTGKSLADDLDKVEEDILKGL
jgi:hypothetical protein